MSTRTGLDDVTVALLHAVDDLAPGRGYAHAPDVLERLTACTGLGPRYGWLLLCDLAAPWRRHLPLLDVQGNIGSQHGDPPAEPGYCEVRLSPAGALGRAAERGELGPVPFTVIDGDVWAGGTIPPFDPRAVVDALRALPAPHPAPTPALPGGGVVEGDVAALLRGDPVRLTLACRIEDGEPHPQSARRTLVITGVPFDVPVDQVLHALRSRIEHTPRIRYADYQSDADHGPDADPPVSVLEAAPVVDITDRSSMRGGLRVACTVAEGAEPAQALAWLRGINPVCHEVEWQLDAPMAQRLTGWDRGDGTGLAALAALLSN